MGNGLEGLGNINTNNASATVESPTGFLAKSDTDNRKIILDNTKFNTNTDVANYLADWLRTQCNLEAYNTDDVVSLQIPGNGIATSYIIKCIKDENEFMQLVQNIETINNTGTKTVLFGYYNVPKTPEIEGRIKQSGIELFTLQDIYDVNGAIDSADRKLPYLNISQGKLSSIIAKIVNEKYKQQGTLNASTIFGDKQQLTGLGAAFTEGLNQLKGSLTGAISSVKSVTGNNGQTPTMSCQIPQTMGNRPTEVGMGQTPIMSEQEQINVTPNMSTGEAHHIINNQIGGEAHPVTLKKHKE